MIGAETKCAAQWNSDAIERLGRQRQNSRSTHGVGGRERRKCGASDLGMRSGGRPPVSEKSWIQDSDPENHEKSTDIVVGARFHSGTKRLEHTNTSEELLDGELAGECERDEHSEER